MLVALQWQVGSCARLALPGATRACHGTGFIADRNPRSPGSQAAVPWPWLIPTPRPTYHFFTPRSLFGATFPRKSHSAESRLSHASYRGSQESVSGIPTPSVQGHRQHTSVTSHVLSIPHLIRMLVATTNDFCSERGLGLGFAYPGLFLQVDHQFWIGLPRVECHKLPAKFRASLHQTWVARPLQVRLC
eukprot:COSAG01_NODE_19686_length_995_cov_2.224330_1_plen_188_part_10